MKFAAALATSLALVTSGCALFADGPPGLNQAGPGSLSEQGDLSNVTLTVGGKEFTEQLILCEVAAQALSSTGAIINRNCGMSGSATVRSALLSGDIDLYWEYTGTGWISNLQETRVIADPAELFTELNAADQAKNQITWLDPSPANNTYAVAVASERAEGATTISDYATVVNADPKAGSFCAAAEFLGRNDGLPGLEKAYGFKLPEDAISELAAGPIYNAIDEANPCVFGEVFATDGRIKALDLTVLEDDKQFFTPYNPAVSVRSDALAQSPQLAAILAPVSQALTNDTLQDLNAQVDVDGRTPEEVANAWLTEQGFINGAS